MATEIEIRGPLWASGEGTCNVCRVEFVSGRKPVDMHVVTKGKGVLGEETRALEVRKLCFLDLTRGIYDND